MAVLDGQQPDPLDVGEAALATIGLTKVLNGEMPYVGVMLQRRILDIPKRIQAAAKQLVADELPRKLDMPRPFPYQKMLDTFLQPIPGQAIENIQHKFPDNVSDMSIHFVQFLSGVYRHLADLLPVQVYQTALGPKHIQPPSDKLWKFYSQYWVIDNPLIALTLAQCGALLPAQVATLQQFYPTLHEHMKSSVYSALVSHASKKADFINLPPRADRGISVLRGQKMVPFGSNKHVITPEQAQPQVNPVTSSNPSKTLESPAQKAGSL